MMISLLPPNHRLICLVFLVAAIIIGTAEACSCVEPNSLKNSLASEYNPIALRARVGKLVDPVKFVEGDEPSFQGFLTYTAFAKIPYKAQGLGSDPTSTCAAMNQQLKKEKILVRTGSNSALCGVELETKTSYLLFGSLTYDTHPQTKETVPVLTVGSCAYQAKWSTLGNTEKRILRKARKCTCGKKKFCPAKATKGVEDVVIALPSCESDSDCNGVVGEEGIKEGDNNSYCSNGQCRAMGTCADLRDCYNPSNFYITAKCTGYLTCNDNGLCRQVCSEQCQCEPTTECDDKSCVCPAVVQCLADPCQTSECSDGTKGTRCVSNYCGGCNALFYGPKGEPVCA